jgi:hypothetical protein
MTTKSKKAAPITKKFDYKTIKTFEDACKKIGVDQSGYEALADVSSIPDEFRKSITAHNKLLIIYKAINNGWKPDYSNWDQYKYYPWFKVLSSGFGFSLTYYLCDHTCTRVGSRLCTDTSEKALYIAKQFEALYQDYLLFSE